MKGNLEDFAILDGSQVSVLQKDPAREIYNLSVADIATGKILLDENSKNIRPAVRTGGYTALALGAVLCTLTAIDLSPVGYIFDVLESALVGGIAGLISYEHMQEERFLKKAKEYGLKPGQAK